MSLAAERKDPYFLELCLNQNWENDLCDALKWVRLIHGDRRQNSGASEAGKEHKGTFWRMEVFWKCLSGIPLWP